MVCVSSSWSSSCRPLSRRGPRSCFPDVLHVLFRAAWKGVSGRWVDKLLLTGPCLLLFSEGPPSLPSLSPFRPSVRPSVPILKSLSQLRSIPSCSLPPMFLTLWFYFAFVTSLMYLFSFFPSDRSLMSVSLFPTSLVSFAFPVGLCLLFFPFVPCLMSLSLLCFLPPAPHRCPCPQSFVLSLLPRPNVPLSPP